MIGLLSFPTGEETEQYIERTDQMVSKELKGRNLAFCLHVPVTDLCGLCLLVTSTDIWPLIAYLLTVSMIFKSQQVCYQMVLQVLGFTFIFLSLRTVLALNLAFLSLNTGMIKL